MKIICFPHAGGSACAYSKFTDYFRNKAEFITYEYDGHGSKRKMQQYTDFSSTVNLIVNDIISHILKGQEDFCLMGHSMGAYVAVEVAYILQELYDYHAKAIFISGQSSPIDTKNDFADSDEDKFLEYIKSLGGMDETITQDLSSMKFLLEPTRNDLRLLTTYHAAYKNFKLKSDIFVMYGNDDVEIETCELGLWGNITEGELKVKMFSGGHFYLLDNYINVLDYISEILKERGLIKMDDKETLFWAPNVRWKIENGELVIETIVFHGNYNELFPEFYFMCSNGTTMDDLIIEFEKFGAIKVKKFINKLKSLRILINSIQNVFEIFSSQQRLFLPKNELSHDYFMSSDNVAEYRKACLVREAPEGSEERYDVKANVNLGNIFSGRRSIREFSQEKSVSYEQLCTVLQSITQYPSEDTFNYYYYPSAGGLYPIDCYILIKEGRVENVDKGLYYYDPVRKKLCYISSGDSIQRDCHYFINKDIFETSAFSMYLFYNASVTMPKYGGKGYYYGILDAGIMVAYLNMAATLCELGCCCIGDLRFSNIEKDFKLNKFQTFLHCIEFGNS